jgi:hypothetical protein
VAAAGTASVSIPRDTTAGFHTSLDHVGSRLDHTKASLPCGPNPRKGRLCWAGGAPSDWFRSMTLRVPHSSRRLRRARVYSALSPRSNGFDVRFVHSPAGARPVTASVLGSPFRLSTTPVPPAVIPNPAASLKTACDRPGLNRWRRWISSPAWCRTNPAVAPTGSWSVGANRPSSVIR